MSDEEKKTIKGLEWSQQQMRLGNLPDYDQGHYADIRIVLNLIEKQSKEIEELKEDRKKYAEEYIHNNPWLYKQLNENYILRVESEQRERKAYIKGTNDAHELCNKKWEDKIKAKIEEIDFMIKEINQGNLQKYTVGELLGAKRFLESLLEKE